MCAGGLYSISAFCEEAFCLCSSMPRVRCLQSPVLSVCCLLKCAKERNHRHCEQNFDAFLLLLRQVSVGLSMLLVIRGSSRLHVGVPILHGSCQLHAVCCQNHVAALEQLPAPKWQLPAAIQVGAVGPTCQLPASCVSC
jgi:hypothetical protein